MRNHSPGKTQSLKVMSEMFSSEIFNVDGFKAKNSSTKGFDSDDGAILGKSTYLYEEDLAESGEVDSVSSDFGFYVENIARDGHLVSKCQEEHQLQLFPDFEVLDNMYLNIASPPFQPCHEEIAKLAGEPKKEKHGGTPFDSLAILKSFGNGFRRLKGEKIKFPAYGVEWTEPNLMVGDRKLSTVDLLRLAGEKFVHRSSQIVGDGSTSCHPFGSSFLNLSDEESNDVGLVQSLLAAAEKVGKQQYNRASKLLSLCDQVSSDAGNPVQKIVYYFSEALREKIEKATGIFMSKRSDEKQMLDINKAMRSLDSPSIAFHEKVPFAQICEFAGMQAVIEHVADAKKIRLIDLDIRCGIQCSVLMQALAARSECPVEILKITAVGTNSKSEIEDTGKRLLSFAQSINLPLCFSVVMVSDMLDLKEELFDLEADEAIAVNAAFLLRAMLSTPNQLESLMRVLRSITPCVMVVTEVEANHNSPVFVNRFIETLFFYGAYFDCLEHFLDQNDPSRKIAESVFFAQGIRNKVAAEGEERILRNVNISVWRAFFARYGMVEEELSTASFYQANMVAKSFPCGSCCTFDMDGNSLIIGWKGTPLHSLSAWKFL